MKKIKALGILLSLALMLGLMPGMSFLTAKAAEESESFTTNTEQSVYTGSHFTISVDDAGDGDGFFMNSAGSDKAIIAARNGEIITKVELTRGYYYVEAVRATAGTVTYSGDVATVSGVNANSLTLYAEGKHVQIKQVVVYYTDPISVTGVTLNEYSTTLSVGETVSLKATIAPDNATDKTVKWSVSGDSVKLYSDSACTTEVGTGAVSALTVYAKGISGGNSTVTVTTNDQSKTASCSVTVSKEDQTVTAPAAVSGLVYNSSAQTLVTAATVTEGNTSDGSISYSLDGSAWSISLPQGTDAGNYTVYYKVAGNENYNEFVCSAPVSVTIAKSDPEAPTGLTATVGQTLANVTLPEGWTWADSSESVGEAGTKTFKANFAGDANYNSAENVDVTVTVSAIPVTGVTLDKTSLTLKEGDSATLTATVAPSNAANKSVTWSVAPEGVVTVADGKVTAVAPGTATVTVTTDDGGKTATCTVTVKPVIKVIEGAGGTHKIKKDGDLLFRFEIAGHDGETFDAFKAARDDLSIKDVVTVSGKNYSKTLAETDYKAEKGSLKLTLTKAYLDTLKPGDYTVTVKFKISGSVYESSSTFKIASSGGTDSPGTGENIMLIASMTTLFILSLSAIAYMALRKRGYFTAKN